MWEFMITTYRRSPWTLTFSTMPRMHPYRIFILLQSVVTGDKARVDVHFKNFGDPTKLVFRMGHTPDGWRVEDIEYRNHTSLLKLLTSERQDSKNTLAFFCNAGIPSGIQNTPLSE